MAIIGKKCLTSLLENLDYTDNGCMKSTIPKALGLGIVVGGSIVKTPQILIIQMARSARGLSVSAFTMELISCAISTVYNVRNAFLALQNAIITLQILHYQPTQPLATRTVPRCWAPETPCSFCSSPSTEASVGVALSFASVIVGAVSPLCPYQTAISRALKKVLYTIGRLRKVSAKSTSRFTRTASEAIRRNMETIKEGGEQWKLDNDTFFPLRTSLTINIPRRPLSPPSVRSDDHSSLSNQTSSIIPEPHEVRTAGPTIHSSTPTMGTG